MEVTSVHEKTAVVHNAVAAPSVVARVVAVVGQVAVVVRVEAVEVPVAVVVQAVVAVAVQGEVVAAVVVAAVAVEADEKISSIIFKRSFSCSLHCFIRGEPKRWSFA